MAVVSSSSTWQNSATGRHDQKQPVEADQESSDGHVFEMISLRNHLPQKRKGLSTFFSGKSRSFKCMADAKCVDDLKKAEVVPEAKRRKLYTDRRSDDQVVLLPLFSHRVIPTASSSCCTCTGAVLAG